MLAALVVALKAVAGTSAVEDGVVMEEEEEVGEVPAAVEQV